MKIGFISAFVFFFAVSRVFSVPLESLLTPAQITQLRSNSAPLMETQLRSPSPRLLPQNNELRQLVSRTMSALNPGIFVEALYLYGKPAASHTENRSWNAGQKARVFNQMLAISSLTGIQYFSASRSAMRTFYEYSSVIDGPSTGNPMPDLVFAQPPAGLTLFARQKDLTFGDNIYRYEYTTVPDALFFTQENITPLNYGIIPAIGRGNLRSVLAVIDCGDSILIYAVSMAKAVSVPGMQNRISSSFGNRAEAVLKWFSGRLDREFPSQ